MVGIQLGEESLPVLLVVVDPVVSARPEVEQQPVRSSDAHVSVGGWEEGAGGKIKAENRFLKLKTGVIVDWTIYQQHFVLSINKGVPKQKVNSAFIYLSAS